MYRYTTRDVHCYLWRQEKMHCTLSVQQVWRFVHRFLQLHWRRVLYLSLPIDVLYLRLPIDSVGHCIIYANIKVFSEPHFPIYEQNPRTYTWIQGHILKSLFHILMNFNKKATTFKKVSLQFSINSSKYVHFWTLVLNTILILIKFLFQRYISCRH